MHIEDLTREYSAKSDEELLRLAGESKELTETAQLALAGELAKRRINVAEHLESLHDEGAAPTVQQIERPETLPPGDSLKVSQFVAQVLEVYHNHFWLSPGSDLRSPLSSWTATESPKRSSAATS